MPVIVWSDAFATGIPEIDEHHRMLFKMAGDYSLTLAEGAGGRVYGLMLEALNDYAQAHFSIEEGCMFAYSCPAAAANCDAHARFVERLSEFRARYAAKGFDAADAQQLVDYLEGWLVNHIARIDVTLYPCVQGKSRR